MAVYTEELATDIVKPHINIYRKYKDGVQYGWRLEPGEDYVMYDRTENNTELDPDTMEEIPVTYYRTGADLPLNYPFGDNFPYVAVLRSDVNENYIFGSGDNDHKVI